MNRENNIVHLPADTVESHKTKQIRKTYPRSFQTESCKQMKTNVMAILLIYIFAHYVLLLKAAIRNYLHINNSEILCNQQR